jgi:hypothetical protein
VRRPGASSFSLFVSSIVNNPFPKSVVLVCEGDTGDREADLDGITAKVVAPQFPGSVTEKSP